jgi:hypothetical protein
MERPPNRFERLAKTHPALHEFVMDKLGLREVLAWVRKYAPPKLKSRLKDGFSSQKTLF